ncbi:MAG: RluA family pseudouridine synthase [Saccharofermentanales bacterium]|jgi:23S rRNA pseudouridine1911/1915/1917 synthase
MRVTYRVTENDRGERVDRLLASRFSDVSRTRWRRQIEAGDVTVNGRAVAPSYAVAEGDAIEAWRPDEAAELTPEAMDLNVIYEDAALAVVDKPAGMVVHPSHGHATGTLVHALLARYGDTLSTMGGAERPGIVHRLDKDTSGLLVIARTDDAHAALARQFRNRTVERIYDAVVWGVPDVDRARIEVPIGRGDVRRQRMDVREDGKEAITAFDVVAIHDRWTHVRCHLITGRTHQIRVHLAYIGHPVVGDLLYGGRRGEGMPDVQLLHASGLSFVHPASGEVVSFESPLPKSFAPFLSKDGDAR